MMQQKDTVNARPMSCCQCLMCHVSVNNCISDVGSIISHHLVTLWPSRFVQVHSDVHINAKKSPNDGVRILVIKQRVTVPV